MVKLRQIDTAFLEQLQNPYLRNSYESQLIAGLSGSYIFNNQKINTERNSLALRFNFETNGNLIDGLSHLFGRSSGEEYYKLFGIRYAQYFRFDLNLARKFAIAFGYTKLLEESNDVLTELKNVVNITTLSMTDKERMDVVERCYSKMKRYRNLVSYYTNKNISVSYLRAKKKNDLDRIMGLYGNMNERYW